MKFDGNAGNRILVTDVTLVIPTFERLIDCLAGVTNDVCPGLAEKLGTVIKEKMKTPSESENTRNLFLWMLLRNRLILTHNPL